MCIDRLQYSQHESSSLIRIDFLKQQMTRPGLAPGPLHRIIITPDSNDFDQELEPEDGIDGDGMGHF